MKAATATGWAMNAVCDPAMDLVVAPIRSAMNRSASGAMALSCSATRYHDGVVFQPAAVAFSVSAASDSGRWVVSRRQGVVELRHTPHDLAHCRCAAWAFVVCLNATGHDRASQFPLPSFGAYASFTTRGICPKMEV